MATLPFKTHMSDSPKFQEPNSSAVNYEVKGKVLPLQAGCGPEDG